MYILNGHTLQLEFREYVFDPTFPLITLLEGDFPFQPPSSIPTKMHFHNCIEIGICHKGKQNLYIEDRHMIFEEGDICIIPPYTMHITSSDSKSPEEISCEYLYFIPEFFLKDLSPDKLPDELLWYRQINEQTIFHQKDIPEISYILSAILQESRRKDSYYNYCIHGQIHMLLIWLERLTSPTKISEINFTQNSPISPAITYINNHFSESISIKELATLCHMSTSTFHSNFEKLIQRTPSEYLRHIRLEYACELLYSTEKSILDISLECGFSSVSNFNRYFRKVYKKSPREWRNNRRLVKKKNIHHTIYLHKGENYDTCTIPTLQPPH